MIRRPTVASCAGLAMVLAGAFSLGACKKESTPGKAAAAGEILPRSVTDDMLPYDTVRSQAQLASPDSGAGTANAGEPAAAPSETADAGLGATAAEAPEEAAPAGTVTPAAE